MLQVVEPVIPNFTEWLNKIRYFFHFHCIDMVVDFPAVLFLSKQFAFGEDLQMLGDGRPCCIKI